MKIEIHVGVGVGDDGGRVKPAANSRWTTNFQHSKFDSSTRPSQTDYHVFEITTQFTAMLSGQISLNSHRDHWLRVARRIPCLCSYSTFKADPMQFNLGLLVAVVHLSLDLWDLLQPPT